MKIDYGKIAISGIIAVAASIGVLLSKKLHLAAKGEAVVFLRTIPESVQLKLDNHSLFDGQYTPTPVEINVKKGRHILKIVRMGYASQIIKLEVNSNQPIRMENVVLGESSDFTTAKVKFTYSGIASKVFAEIDHGFISEKLPFIADNLEAEQTHSVRFTVELGSETRVYSCNFQIPKNLPSPLRIHLSQENSKIAVSGCRHYPLVHGR